MHIGKFIETESVVLRPRPYALSAGIFLLLPLLPQPQPLKSLPYELWTHIFEYVFADYNLHSGRRSDNLKIPLLLICKSLKDVVLPLYYGHIHLTTLSALIRFAERVYEAERKWDSIRRIPYSAPGRWVHTLDLSELHFTEWAEACEVDALLTRIFPILPFLQTLRLNASITLSRRAIDTLSSRDGQLNLRSLKGIKLVSNPAHEASQDPFFEVLRTCQNLEELTIVGSGFEAIHSSATTGPRHAEEDVKGFELPRLHKLAIISMHESSIMLGLLHSSLPALRHLTVTPYDDVSIPISLVPKFIETHGPKLASLHLYAHKSWPTMLFPSPTTLLHTCPQLIHLSLEHPLPTLTICSIYPRHPLKILSIPRPNPEFLSVLESLLPKLPDLSTVRARDVRWLRRGMTSHAQEAGVQGELREWKRRLSRRGVQVVDADWKDGVD